MSAEQPFHPDPRPVSAASSAPVGIPRQRPASEPTTAAATGNTVGAAMTIAGGALVAVGSFLPWLTITAPLVGTISRSGMDNNGDGMFTILLGVVIIGLGAARFGRDRRAIRIGVGVLSALTIWIAAVDIVGVNERIHSLDNAYVLGSVGAGLYVIILGAGLAVVGARNRRPGSV